MQRRIPIHEQEDLFGTPEMEAMRRRVKALDREIAEALRKKEYDRAKAMTEEQAALIRRLVEWDEASDHP